MPRHQGVQPLRYGGTRWTLEVRELDNPHFGIGSPDNRAYVRESLPVRHSTHHHTWLWDFSPGVYMDDSIRHGGSPNCNKKCRSIHYRSLHSLAPNRTVGARRRHATTRRTTPHTGVKSWLDVRMVATHAFFWPPVQPTRCRQVYLARTGVTFGTRYSRLSGPARSQTRMGPTPGLIPLPASVRLRRGRTSSNHHRQNSCSLASCRGCGSTCRHSSRQMRMGCRSSAHSSLFVLRLLAEPQGRTLHLRSS